MRMRLVMPELLLAAALTVSLPLLAQAYVAGSGAVSPDLPWQAPVDLGIAVVRGLATAVTLTYGVFVFGHALAQQQLRHRIGIAAIWALTLVACVLLSWPYAYARVTGQELHELPSWWLAAMSLAQILAPELVAVGAAILLADPDYRVAAAEVSQPASRSRSRPPAPLSRSRSADSHDADAAAARTARPVASLDAAAYRCAACGETFDRAKALNAHGRWCRAKASA